MDSPEVFDALCSAAAPRLTAAEEVSLSRKARRGDHAAISRIVEANVKLCARIAWSFRNCTGPACSVEDLFTEALLGCVQAARRYDPKRGKFSTVIAIWAKQRIYNALADTARTIRLPQNVLNNISKMRRGKAGPGERQTDAELARAAMISPAQLQRALLALQIAVSSTNEPIGEDGTEQGDFIKDTAPQPDEVAEQGEKYASVMRVVRDLPEHERDLVLAHFGLAGVPLITNVEQGRRLGISRERVRILLRHALRRVRHMVQSREHHGRYI